MNEEILGYRKTGKDIWEPIIQRKDYIYTAAVMICGKCNGWITGMGGPGGNNTYCLSCYEKVKNDKGTTTTV